MSLLSTALLLLTLFQAPSPEYRVEEVKGGRIHVWRAPAAGLDMGFLRAGEGAKTLSLSQAVDRKPDAALLFNGGFFLPDYRPLGVMVEGGQLKNPVRKADWGVFYVTRAGKPAIIHRSAFDWDRLKDDVFFAVECGPRIIAEGKVLSTKASSERRTLLAVDAAGNLLVVVYSFPVELSEVAENLLDRWKVTDAMNLDGGSSTQLAAPGADGGLRVVVPGIPVPYFIYLKQARASKEEIRSGH